MVGGTEAREEGLRSTCVFASLPDGVLGMNSLEFGPLVPAVKSMTRSCGAMAVLLWKSFEEGSFSPPASLSRASRMADIV